MGETKEKDYAIVFRTERNQGCVLGCREFCSSRGDGEKTEERGGGWEKKEKKPESVDYSLLERGRGKKNHRFAEKTDGARRQKMH